MCQPGPAPFQVCPALCPHVPPPHTPKQALAELVTTPPPPPLPGTAWRAQHRASHPQGHPDMGEPTEVKRSRDHTQLDTAPWEAQVP